MFKTHEMKNAFLYVITVLIWGSTWITIEYQIHEAPVEVTLLYRFIIAFVIMFSYALWKKIPLKFDRKQHSFFLLLAILNFSINYYILYEAQKYLNSAMTSIAFSTMLLVNIINTRLFFGVKIKAKVYVGAFFGLSGIVTLFYPSIADQNFDQNSITGLVLVLSGTIVSSLGNMVSVRNSRARISVLSANTWSMFYGTIIMLSIVLLSDIEFVLPSLYSYWFALSYVAIFGTVIAFASYYALLNNIGVEKASYTIVLFPVVAIIISIFAEDFQITGNVLIGISLVAMGNILVLTPLEKLKAFRVKRIRKPISEVFVSLPK